MDTSWDGAREAAYALSTPLRPVDLPLTAAIGSVLARPLRALSPAPAFDTAAMDGYAYAGQGPWLVVGSLPAGEAPWQDRLTAGTAVEIATGAAVPRGACGVVPYESAERIGDKLMAEVEPGRHIRRTGEECVVGDVLLPDGAPVTPAVAGLAAATGHDVLAVRPAPRVGVLVTGDELLTSGFPGHGRVRDALGPMLTGLVPSLGGNLVLLRHLPDAAGPLREAIASFSGDALVVTGSSSAGPADHLHAVLHSLEAGLVVDGVACRPGHPQLLARLPRGGPLIGLPGNPLAALVAALTLLAPSLDRMRGIPLWPLRSVANGGVRGHERTTRLVPVSLRDGQVMPQDWASSAMLRSAACADAMAVVNPGAQPGEPLRLLPLPWRRSSCVPHPGRDAFDRQ